MSSNLKDIRFFHESGSETHCKTCSLALVYWYGLRGDKILPQPYSKVFLPCVIRRMEQTFQQELPSALKNPPPTPASDGQGDLWEPDEVIACLNSGDIAVENYENHCFQMLLWLAAYGDITSLQVGGVEWRNPSKKYRSIDDAWESS